MIPAGGARKWLKVDNSVLYQHSLSIPSALFSSSPTSGLRSVAAKAAFPAHPMEARRTKKFFYKDGDENGGNGGNGGEAIRNGKRVNAKNGLRGGRWQEVAAGKQKTLKTLTLPTWSWGCGSMQAPNPDRQESGEDLNMA